MKAYGKVLISVLFLYLFCLGGTSSGQDLTKNTSLGYSKKTLSPTSFSSTTGKDIAHYLQSHIVNKLINLRFLKITKDFLPENTEVDHSFFSLKKKESLTVKKLIVEHNQRLSEYYSRNTKLINRNIVMLRRFKPSTTIRDLFDHALPVGKYNGLKISMKWE